MGLLRGAALSGIALAVSGAGLSIALALRAVGG